MEEKDIIRHFSLDRWSYYPVSTSPKGKVGQEVGGWGLRWWEGEVEQKESVQSLYAVSTRVRAVTLNITLAEKTTGVSGFFVGSGTKGNRFPKPFAVLRSLSFRFINFLELYDIAIYLSIYLSIYYTIPVKSICPPLSRSNRPYRPSLSASARGGIQRLWGREIVLIFETNNRDKARDHRSMPSGPPSTIYLCRGCDLPSTSVPDMALNYIWWRDYSFGALITWSTPSLLLLSGSLWPRMGIPIRVFIYRLNISI